MGVTTSPGAKQSCDYPSWEVLKSRLFPFSESSPDIWEEGDGKSPPMTWKTGTEFRKAGRNLRKLPEAGMQGMARGTSAAPWKGPGERTRGKDEGNGDWKDSG